MDRKIIVLALSTLLILISCTLRADTLDITFLDVAEGEAIVVKSGKHTALIDTGNIVSGHRVVQYLQSRDIAQLDMLLITHPHLDHLSGVFQILPHITVKQRYDNGQTLPQNQDIYRWYQDSFRTSNYRALNRGDVLALGETKLTVLSSLQTGNMNRRSLVLLVEHGEVRVLLMGDADVSVEATMMEQIPNLNAKLLKLGHHGSENSTSQPFLDRVDPDYAVISTNADNIRGYPSPLIMDRVRQQGIDLLLTYEDGDICFRSDGEDLSPCSVIPVALGGPRTGG